MKVCGQVPAQREAAGKAPRSERESEGGQESGSVTGALSEGTEASPVMYVRTKGKKRMAEFGVGVRYLAQKRFVKKILQTEEQKIVTLGLQ